MDEQGGFDTPMSIIVVFARNEDRDDFEETLILFLLVPSHLDTQATIQDVSTVRDTSLHFQLCSEFTEQLHVQCTYSPF